MSQDAVCSLLSRAPTTHVEERESELEPQRLDKKEEPGERSSERCPPRAPPVGRAPPRRAGVDQSVSSRSWQAESVDSGCSNSTAFAGACSEGLCGEGVCVASGGRCERSRMSVMKVNVGEGRGVPGQTAEGVRVWVAGGEGHHDGGLVPGAGPSPAQREGRALGSRLAVHARQHHRALSDLFPGGSESVRLQGESPGGDGTWPSFRIPAIP